jgi:RimJ/RimL family protein N-acetyltransferase
MSAPEPAKGPPERVTLEGRYGRLEPIGAHHVADLYRAIDSGDGRARFTYLFDEAPANEAELGVAVQNAAAGDDPLTYAVIDRETGRAEGRQSLMRIVPEHGVIEIGGIYWGPGMARTRLATEALYLHARYVFDTLGYRRFEWKCNDRNAPSKAAAQRFGFVYEGLFRQHMIIKGENRDTAWFAMLDRDWPALRTEYERWLSADNFDASGRQLSPLRFANTSF